MSYEPTVWKDGDLVTSAKLNKLEQGVAGGGSGALIVNYNDGDLTDKTWQEIYDAVLNGQIIYLKDNRSDDIAITLLNRIQHYDNSSQYYIIFDNNQYIAYSADGYLTLDAR